VEGLELKVLRVLRVYLEEILVLRDKRALRGKLVLRDAQVLRV
jgi:hypothetical protein